MICSDLVCLLHIASSANSLILELVTDNGMSFMKARNSTGLGSAPLWDSGAYRQRLAGFLVYYSSLYAVGQERVVSFVGCASYAM